MVKKFSLLISLALLATVLVGLEDRFPAAVLVAQSAPSSPTASAKAASAPSAPANSASPSAKVQSADSVGKPGVASTPFRNQPDRLAKRAVAYYESVWGIDSPSVKAVESGVILRFSYRVLDPEKVKPLNDKKVEPFLICPEKGVKLVIPSMANVGLLRQTTNSPEPGQSYWMAFSNSGRLLKRGDRVDVVIGNFHARGLMIE